MDDPRVKRVLQILHENTREWVVARVGGQAALKSLYENETTLAGAIAADAIKAALRVADAAP